MKIPHLVRDGSFRPLIRKALEDSHRRLPLTVPLRKEDGYPGNILISILSRDEKEFEAEVDLSDWSRFPARIRATATELRDQGFVGRFRIIHNNGVLIISLA
jgi:hypothetical protein